MSPHARTFHRCINSTVIAALFAATFAAAFSTALAAESAPAGDDPRFDVRRIEGWTVYVSRAGVETSPALMRDALEHLKQQLYQIKRVVPAKARAKLEEIPIWVELETQTPCMSYHPRREWLIEHGYCPPGVPSVIEVGNARNFLTWTREQPWMVLHEMAHGYNHLFLSKNRTYEHAGIQAAFKRAVEGGAYASVLHAVRPEPGPHYALNNMMEYFAEATEAYFGTNDFYPFVRAELRELDPGACALLADLWGEKETDAPRPLPQGGLLLTGADSERAADDDELSLKPAPGYAEREIQGWSVRVAPELDRRQHAPDVLGLIDHRLHLAGRAFPPEALAVLKKVPIWLEEREREVPLAAYHGSDSWLRARDRNPAKAGGIEIGDAARFEACADLQPGMMIHLLAYAYHHRVLGFDHAGIKAAFAAAATGGSYDNVLRSDGQYVPHPALAGAAEYFAEAAEAYLSTNDHYPFVRVELRRHDPAIAAILDEIWGRGAK